MAERIGQQLGNYRLERLIGSGGFAEVYLGVHIHLGTQAAIKLLHTRFATSGELEQFRAEAQTIASLQHPHIVRLLDFGVEEGTPYLLLDYAPNGSLRQRFPPGSPLPPVLLSDMGDNSTSLFRAVFVHIRPRFAGKQASVSSTIAPFWRFIGLFPKVRRQK